MLRIGVTGGIGSGKSLVCSLFGRLGVPVLSADALAKELMINDANLQREIAETLGSSAYKPDGSLDREYVASKIFGDKTLYRKINSLVHPRVEQELDRQLDEMGRQGSALAIVEAALIYEAGYDKRLDIVVVVDAPERERIRRVVQRDSTSAEEVRKRARWQWNVDRKARRADYVIKNNGPLEELEASVRFLYNLFTNFINKR